MSNPETIIQNKIRLALGASPLVVLWRLNQGKGKFEDSDSYYQFYGLIPGASDLLGIIRTTGRFIALEVKTARGRVSEEQAQFITLVNASRGYAAVVRSVDEAQSHVAAAARGDTAPEVIR